MATATLRGALADEPPEPLVVAAKVESKARALGGCSRLWRVWRLLRLLIDGTFSESNRLLNIT